MRKIFIFLSFCFSTNAMAQVEGGQNIMSFLRLPNTASATAMGGLCVSNPSSDVLLSMSNPALLRPEFNNQLGLSNNFYYGGTKATNVLYTQFNKKLKTCLSFGLTNVNYGVFKYTNANGYYNSDFTANDYALQISASKKYYKNWRYGATFKYAHSKMWNEMSSALLVDAGIVYFNPEKQFSFGLVAKNFGTIIQKYNPEVKNQTLPYDVQMGISKKFLKAPFRLNALMHHMYQWDISYNNPADITTNELFLDSSSIKKTGTTFADKLFRHFNFSVDLLLGKRIEVTVGYSHQRRNELAISDKKGMSGFSYGLGLNLNKFKIHYARSIYNISGAYNEISINLKLKDLFGIGNKTLVDNNW